MIVIIFLVTSVLLCDAQAQVGISFKVETYTVQFNETAFQRFLKCLCATTFGCEVHYINTSNVLTFNGVLQTTLSNSSVKFYDAFVCNDPVIPSNFFSCTKVIIGQNPLPINSGDKCLTIKYDNYTKCFTNGLALFWSYNYFETVITSPDIKRNNNCAEVVTVSTSVMSSTLLPQATSTPELLPGSSQFTTITSDPSVVNVQSTIGPETLHTTVAYSTSTATLDSSAGTLAPSIVDT
uniref:Uncharacterized protein n=1 Tax=Biomphalaria glabrata TaxID=6526 RepID=A0A2C9LY89_BIOGL